jgi:imidazolonepropionase-like amidohydrolase
MRWPFRAGLLLALALAACTDQKQGKPREPYSSTYAPPAAAAVLIQHATVLTGTGSRIDDGDVLIQDHRIAQVGKGIPPPAGAAVIDAQNRWVTPGIIDPHSHLGVYPSPEVWATLDGNEATSPTTPNVWSEHSVWPQDPGFEQARRGGVTSMLILPGSANLIGGRGTLLKNVPATTYQEMKFPGAPQVLKMACGENPKRVYGRDRHQFPSTWMGDVAGYREAFAKAAAYRAKREAAKKAGKDKDGERDIGMETLADVLDGKILVQMHCYRADQMATMLDVAQEFKFHIAAFHHAVEAYKIGPMLKEHDTCAVMWADWWGFKLEAYDGIRENIAMVDATGACATVHSDDPIGIQRLNQEAGKAMAAGWRAGLDIPRERAIRWITANPAKALGVAARVGTLEPGKDGDVVVWSTDPFSVYAQADLVYIDGVLRFDRAHPPEKPDSDFRLGILGQQEEMP